MYRTAILFKIRRGDPEFQRCKVWTKIAKIALFAKCVLRARADDRFPSRATGRSCLGLGASAGRPGTPCARKLGLQGLQGCRLQGCASTLFFFKKRKEKLRDVANPGALSSTAGTAPER